MRKQTKLGITLLAIAGLSFYSCGDKKEKSAEIDAAEMHEDSAHDELIETDDVTASFKDSTVAAVYEHYTGVKSALVQTNSGQAKEHAQELLEALKVAKDDAGMTEAATQIANSTNVNEQRESFSELTARIEKMLNGALASGEIYKLYCPMAFDGKGDYWYSNSKEILNPYYGEKMLKCGRVEETIK
ncbi:DUF3347 domain-containing protein [Gillisia sp. M10.2A]|uniref:DUF3347 domain-containing protein n=1 Tax=Gillisia lutea TaxID=2909668 RepID=A0ABS9EFF7_9FLAO|nr:DUF3347 domain-containing protein [Gillisia lutea]MCF4100884.1 DUF3347 domain-containing protein [Gillisia lutea]